MRRTLLLLVALVCVAVPFEPAHAKEITIVAPSGVSVTPFYYAVDHKLFEKAGLAVKPIIVTVGKEVIRIFTAGDADIAFTGPGPMGVTIGRGVPAKVLAFFAYGSVAVVTFDPAIKEVKDLKGKRVAISGPGSASEVIGRIVLYELGLDPHKDAQVRPMTGPEMLKAGKLGELDAAITWPPNAQAMVMENPKARILVDVNAEWKRIFNTPVPAVWHGLLVKDKFLLEQPAAVKKIQQVLADAVRKVQHDEDEQVRLLVKYERMREEWARPAVKSGMVVFNPNPTVLTPAERESMMKIMDYMYRFGYMKEKLTPERLFFEWK